MLEKKKIVILGIILVCVLVIIGLIFVLGKEKKIVIENEPVEQFMDNTIPEEVVEEEVASLEENVEVSEEVVQDKVEEKEEVQLPKEEEAVEEKTETSKLDVKDELVNWGYQKSSGRTIDTILIHSSYNALGGDEYDKDLLIKEYKEYGVSPHYLIDRKGNIYRLVEDRNIAWHAGESKTPDGRSGVNTFSIGVELINNKEDEYAKAQYASLNNLLDYLGKKYKIKYILGHSDVSPGRKDDPWNMDWDKVGAR